MNLFNLQQVKKDGIDLRPYQIECLDKLKNHYKNNDCGIISLPTGSGKTIILSKFAYNMDYKKTICIAHRDELIMQNRDKASYFFDDNDCGIIKTAEWEIDKKFISSSIQTLYSRKNSEQFKKLCKKGVDLFIVDEAHHFAEAKNGNNNSNSNSKGTYIDIYNILKEYNPNMKLLGVTATPFRTDKQNLKDYFEHLVYFIDIKDLILQEYLVPIQGHTIALPIELDNLKLNGTTKDFTNKSLTNILNKEKINQLIIDKWKEYANNKKTIFFMSSIEHSKEIVKTFNDNKVKAEHIDGTTNSMDRKRIIDDFKKGNIKIIGNMNVLTEGFDEPAIECISIVRPTKSLSLYTQCIGRGLRISPFTGKKNCTILDYTGISKKYNITGLYDLFGVKKPKITGSLAIGIEYDKETRVKELKLLFGKEDTRFDIEGDVFYYITSLKNDTIRIINCGFNNIIVFIEKNNTGKWDLIIIQNNRGEELRIIEHKHNYYEDIAITTMMDKWHQYKDKQNNMDGIFKKMSDNTPSPGQVKVLNRNKGYIGKLNYNNISRLDASNLIGYVFYKYALWKKNNEIKPILKDEAIKII